MTNDYNFRRIATLKTAADFSAYLAQAGAEIGFDTEVQAGADSPLAQPYQYKDFTIGNRFCILPMEGWDGTLNGKPSELTSRRWKHFGESGAKFIWGGEAVAVRHDGRANPNQLCLNEANYDDIAALRQTLIDAHKNQFGTTDDFFDGLQLTHSGRFSRPHNKTLEPRILYRHPVLDKKFNITSDDAIFTDAEIDALIQDFIIAAVRAQKIGFKFVDIKHCHGYLGHEFLSAYTREGNYGGSFENRTRFLREIVAGIRREAPGLHIGVRLSAYDLIPFKKGEDQRGVPETYEGEYNYAFGVNPKNPLQIDLTETYKYLELLESYDIKLVCITCGSPYYIPHIQRPAIFPPSDGYLPPEDPLVGVARMLKATSEIKAKFPNLAIAGTGYSYLQEWIPNVGQFYVRTGQVDFVGLGRLVLSYPELPADVIAGKPLQTKKLCRTFSDCTTAPRNGLVSGCYPLDQVYKQHEHAEPLKAIKQQMKNA